jgi:hypothetical protein
MQPRHNRFKVNAKVNQAGYLIDAHGFEAINQFEGAFWGAKESASLEIALKGIGEQLVLLR